MTIKRSLLLAPLLIATLAIPTLVGQDAAPRQPTADRSVPLPAFGVPARAASQSDSAARPGAVPAVGTARPAPGQTPASQPASRQPVPGQPVPGQPVPGQTAARQAASGPTASPSSSPRATGYVEAQNAMVILINNVRVPAQVEGVLTAIGVEEGDVVEAGQTLAVIDDEQAQLNLMLVKAQEKEAELNALNTINLRDAKQAEELAREEAVAYADLARQGATPAWDARAKTLEANRAKLRIELAELNERIAQAQYVAKKSERELAEWEISRRQIVAPFDGFVELRIAQLGEWVQPGSPIVQLVQMDRLRAQGAVSAVDPDAVVTPGMPAVVEFNLGGGRIERINGVVGFVGNDVDISNRRRIWVEFENKRLGDGWLIKPGMVPVIRVDNSRIPEANLGQASASGKAVR